MQVLVEGETRLVSEDKDDERTEGNQCQDDERGDEVVLVADVAQVHARFGVAILLAEAAYFHTCGAVQGLPGVFIEEGDVGQVGVEEKEAEGNGDGDEPVVPAGILPLNLLQDDSEDGEQQHLAGKAFGEFEVGLFDLPQDEADGFQGAPHGLVSGHAGKDVEDNEADQDKGDADDTGSVGFFAKDGDPDGSGQDKADTAPDGVGCAERQGF